MISRTDAFARLCASLDIPYPAPAPTAAPAPFHIDDKTFNAAFGIGAGLPQPQPHITGSKETSPILVQTLKAIYRPILDAITDDLAARHPHWSPDEIWNAARPLQNKWLDERISLNAKTYAYVTGQAGRYEAILHLEDSEYQSWTKVEDRVRAVGDSDRRLSHFRSGQIAIVAESWHTYTDEQKETHASALADYVDWPSFPKVRKHLARQIKGEQLAHERMKVEGKPRTIEQAKHDIVTTAVILVLGDWGRERKHRFGDKWMTGDDGKQIARKPDALFWADTWTLFNDEVDKTATNIALDGSTGVTIKRKRVSLVPLDEGRDTTAMHPALGCDPTDTVIGQITANQEMQELFDVATSREGEVFALLLDQKNDDEIAEAMGISRNTARVHKKNLRDKFTELQRKSI